PQRELLGDFAHASACRRDFTARMVSFIHALSSFRVCVVCSGLRETFLRDVLPALATSAPTPRKSTETIRADAQNGSQIANSPIRKAAKARPPACSSHAPPPS